MTHIILIAFLFCALVYAEIRLLLRKDYISAAIIAAILLGLVFAFLPRTD